MQDDKLENMCKLFVKGKKFPQSVKGKLKPILTEDFFNESEIEIDGIMYPVLNAIHYRTGLFVWCKYCNTWHSHGISEGTRTAHCPNITPYRESYGYYIKPYASLE